MSDIDLHEALQFAVMN